MGIFQTVVGKYKEVRQKSRDKKEFKTALLQAVQDGKLTKEEIDALDTKKTELGLTDNEVKRMRAEIFTTAFSVAKSDTQVTKEEEEELHTIQKYLGLSDSEVQPTKKELARLRLLNEIQNGNMPILPPVRNIMMQKGEKAYWVEPAVMYEEQVISRKYQGGSSGMSFRIMKGVSYRVGGHRGNIITEKGIVPISTGELIITSKRLIFRGDSKSFATKLDKILDIRLFTDGVQFSENNKSKPRLVKFQDGGNQDIVGAVLSYAGNHFGE